MPYLDDDGRLNNFAIEPKMYQAEPTTQAQKRNYLVIGILTAILVTALVFVAFSITKVG